MGSCQWGGLADDVPRGWSAVGHALSGSLQLRSPAYLTTMSTTDLSDAWKCFDFVQAPQELVTASGAIDLLAPVGAFTLTQAQMLAAAGVFGPGYAGAFGHAYDAQGIRALAGKPERALGDIGRVKSFKGYNDLLILRMRSIAAVDEDPPRSFLGTHVDAESSSDRAVRRDADEAVRKYWRISAERRRTIARSVRDHGHLPMLVTVSKRIVGARNVTGIDEAATAADGVKVVLNVEPATGWYHDFAGTWLNSGRGVPTIWWERS